MNKLIGAKKTILVLSTLLLLIGCKNDGKKKDQKLRVITTTTMITDLVKNIGDTLITVEGLMGSGVDPHLYKASEGDVSKLYNADIIFYNGLHLEGKLVEVFEKMQKQHKTQVPLGEKLDKTGLIGSDYFASNYDPHVWFNIGYFKRFAEEVTQVLTAKAPQYKMAFEANKNKYLEQLGVLETEVKNKIDELPREKRILVTAHDAFNYFGQAYDFQVVGLQGLSTATEAGVQDVQKLASFIMEKGVKAIFVESSVPRRTIEALQAAVRAKGHEVTIGGTLYSDALGDANTIEGTYIGMFKYNVHTIVEALK